MNGAAVPGNARVGMVAKTEWTVSASSTNSNSTTNAWNVNLANGNTNNNGKTNTNYVSCVR